MLHGGRYDISATSLTETGDGFKTEYPCLFYLSYMCREEILSVALITFQVKGHAVKKWKTLKWVWQSFWNVFITHTVHVITGYWAGRYHKNLVLALKKHSKHFLFIFLGFGLFFFNGLIQLLLRVQKVNWLGWGKISAQVFIVKWKKPLLLPPYGINKNIKATEQMTQIFAKHYIGKEMERINWKTKPNFNCQIEFSGI